MVDVLCQAEADWAAARRETREVRESCILVVGWLGCVKV